MNAVKNVFFAADVSGCYFHFQKAVKKKAKELKLYETRAGRKFTRMVAHLPLLPEDRRSRDTASPARDNCRNRGCSQ